jgi:cell wall-associated NlpC family hydrolase
MTLPAPTPTPAVTPRRHGRLATLGLAVLPPVALVVALAATMHSAAANPPGPDDPIGKLGHITANTDGTAHLVGWAADPDTTKNVTVLALIDGRIVSRVPTSVARPVIARKNHTGATPGFAFDVAVPATGVHVLCAAVRDIGLGSPTVLGCVPTPLGTRLTSGQVAARSPRGVVSAARASSTAVTVSGWSADPDFKRAHLLAVLYLDGQSAQTVTTKVATPAQRAAGSGTYGAFAFSVPVTTGSHNACVWLVNQGLGANTALGCTPLDTRGAAGTAPVKTPAINTKALKEAKKHLGQKYVWGAEGPKTFDCSGLVMYSYHKAGFTTPRIAQDQFTAARVIPASRAVPGDLVFYHDSVGAVYHVGIYVAPLDTVAAIDEAEGIAHQHIWDPSSATYGSFTHT